jgi:hypothetical protein
VVAAVIGIIFLPHLQSKNPFSIIIHLQCFYLLKRFEHFREL